MIPEVPRCQSDTLMGGSQPVPWVIRKGRRLAWYLANRGVVATIAKVASVLTGHPFGKRTPLTAAACVPTRGANVALNLQPGELVEVRPQENILQNLDENWRMCGLLFMQGQLAYCGKQLKVYKRVNHIAVENGGGMRRLKNTVLLEGAICDGKDEGCDRSCFFFWREAWLRRVDGKATSEGGTG